ncbi:MAG TPA: RNase H-like domain-containing protein, partial [Candidatus Babeliaceae bacterium]|nr:RNase H-like domain-containing protein [Candidatus Babeliaceae bacterium]
YRNFIPKFSDLAAPLDDLKKADTPYIWTNEHQLAFDTLKQKLTTYPVLRIPDYNKPFILDTDASTIGIGGILQQYDENINAPYVVSYFSRKLTEAEKKHSITDLEAIAMRDSIRKFSRYLIGRTFKVRTDHISLTYIQNLKTLTGKLGRISLDLQAYDYTIEYKPGRLHTNVDCLSRLPAEDDPMVISNINVSTKADLSAFVQIQQADPFTAEVIKHVKNPDEENMKPNMKEFLYSNKNLTFRVEDNVLKVLDKRTKNNTHQIVIPEADQHIQLQLTQLLHNPQHQGVDKLYKTMKQKFYWPTMKTYLQNYVDACTICQKTKRNYHNDIIQRKMIVNQSIKDADAMCEPLSQITIDHLDLPLTESGYKCLLVIVDRATRLVKAIPCKTHETTEFIDNLIEHWIFTYGVPRVILSDRGSAFVSTLMKQLNKVLQIDHVLSSAYNPQSHGLVERANQSIQQIMRALLLAHQDAERQWDKYINHVIFIMNTTVNNSTGFTPYELVYGRKACYPIDRLLHDDEIFESIGDYLQDLIRKHKVNYSVVHSNLLSEKQKNDLYNNENSDKIRLYNIGDLVYKARYTRKNKLTPLYEGPYTVIKKINDLCYQIKLADNDLAPTLLVNIRQLKPFIDANKRITTADEARKSIDEVMRDFNSAVQYRHPISQDDFMSDAEIDLILNNQ